MKILEWLSKIEYIKHHRNALDGILKDTGGWLVNRQEFRQWQSCNVSSILWLHGIRRLTRVVVTT